MERERQSPLERPEFGQFSKITSVCCNYGYSRAARAHCNQSVISQTTLANLFKAVFGGEQRQYPSCLCPIAEVRHQQPPGAIKIAFETRH